MGCGLRRTTYAVGVADTKASETAPGLMPGGSFELF